MKSAVSGKRICLRNELETTLIGRKDFSTSFFSCSIMYTSVKGGFIENHTTAFGFQRIETNFVVPRDRSWMQEDIRFQLWTWNWYEWSKADLTVTLNTFSSFLACSFLLPSVFFLFSCFYPFPFYHFLNIYFLNLFSSTVRSFFHIALFFSLLFFLKRKNRNIRTLSCCLCVSIIIAAVN